MSTAKNINEKTIINHKKLYALLSEMNITPESLMFECECESVVLENFEGLSTLDEHKVLLYLINNKAKNFLSKTEFDALKMWEREISERNLESQCELLTESYEHILRVRTKRSAKDLSTRYGLGVNFINSLLKKRLCEFKSGLVLFEAIFEDSNSFESFESEQIKKIKRARDYFFFVVHGKKKVIDVNKAFTELVDEGKFIFALGTVSKGFSLSDLSRFGPKYVHAFNSLRDRGIVKENPVTGLYSTIQCEDIEITNHSHIDLLNDMCSRISPKNMYSASNRDDVSVPDPIEGFELMRVSVKTARKMAELMNKCLNDCQKLAEADTFDEKDAYSSTILSLSGAVNSLDFDKFRGKTSK